LAFRFLEAHPTRSAEAQNSVKIILFVLKWQITNQDGRKTAYITRFVQIYFKYLKGYYSKTAMSRKTKLSKLKS